MAIKEIKIELLNDKKETVVYKTNFVPARKVREGLEISALGEKGGNEIEVVDKMISFVASLFDGLTEDMILDGIAAWDLFETLQVTISEVLGADPKQTANV